MRSLILAGVLMGFALAQPAFANCKDDLDLLKRKVGTVTDRNKKIAVNNWVFKAEKELLNGSDAVCHNYVIGGWREVQKEPPPKKALANVDTPFINVKPPY